MQNPTDEMLRPWLAFFHLPGLSLLHRHRLLAQWQTPAAILARPLKELKAAGLPGATAQCLLAYQRDPARSELGREVERSLAWRGADQQILCLEHASYPAALKEIELPPSLLFVVGDPAVLLRPQLAMVGSRHATAASLETAFDFAYQLAGLGLGITSGLALGVDAASHRGALEAGGTSIAVLATGADRLYPRQHQALAVQLRSSGALVSEFPLGTKPLPARFPQRNRIISGLSLGTLVVAAAAKSGSLITAYCAAQQGREVFAIPGSIHQPTARGCHQLIRAGAKLVESVTDIIEELPQLAAVTQLAGLGSATDTPLGGREQRLLDLIDYQASAFDLLLAHTGWASAELAELLMQLELQGYVEQVPGGYARRIGSRRR